MLQILTILGLNKSPVKLIGTALMVILLIWFLNKKYNQVKANKQRNRTEPDLNDSNLILSSDKYRSIALRLHNAFKGVSWTYSENREQTTALRALNELNDDEFKQVYIYFNDLVDPPNTLRIWINGEYMPWSTEDGEALTRMTTLGLA